MRNVSYVGLCWAMILGLVAVALGEQRPTKFWQNAPPGPPKTIEDNTWHINPQPQQDGAVETRQVFNGPAVQLDQQPGLPAPDRQQDRSLITGTNELPDPAKNDGQQRGVLGVWMGATGGAGVQILRVTGDSAAERAGLRVGDIILQVNGRGATSPQDTARLIKQFKIGEAGALTVWRNGNQQQVQVTLQPVREIARETARKSTPKASSGRSDSANTDLASRTKRLEQQINSLTQELATLRQELAQLRTNGPVQTGFNANTTPSAPLRQPQPQPNVTPQPAEPTLANPVAPPPGFEAPKDNAPGPAPEAALPAAPPVATPTPAPTPATEKSAPDDLFGSNSAQPKSDEKSKTEEKPKADDKAGSDDLFK